MEKCTGAVVKWMIQHNAIDVREKELYEYALHSAVLLILPLLLAGVLGFCFGSIKTGILVVIPFMILRKFSGGYHAKKLIHCLISSALLLFLCILFATNVTHDWVVLVAAGIASVSLMIFSPIEHENRLLDEDEKRDLKKMTIFLVCILNGLGIILFLLGNRKTAISFFTGIILAAGLQIPSVAKRIWQRPNKTAKCRLAQKRLKLREE